MIIFKNVADLSAFVEKQAALGKKIGFVPTMGALHQGHISLVEISKKETDVTISSIFLNPTQFNDKSDFDKYPVSTNEDIVMLEAAACDVLFLPSVTEIYPDGTDAMKVYDFGFLETVLEGAQRPGHFKGVGQVVSRLLNIVQPHVLFLGQKDYQQCMVITDLVRQMGLLNLKIRICPTFREDDGLAMSSRNRRLTAPQRALAPVIYQCLVSIATKQGDGDFGIVRKQCEDLMTDKGFEVEYVSLSDANSLQPLNGYEPQREMVALIAAKIGPIRLIDNMVIN